MADDRTRTGYDQADEYTKKNATIGIESPPAYEQTPPHAFGAEPPPGYEQALPQEDGGNRPPPYAQTSTNVVVDEPRQFEGVVVQKRPMDYTVPSILACLCCFWPIAICAMFYATDANTLWKNGDFEGARRRAKISRNLTIASVVLGTIGLAFLFASRVHLMLQKHSDNQSEIDQSGVW